MHRGNARAGCCASSRTSHPANQTRQRGLTIPTEWFRWLPASAVSLFTLQLGAPPSAESVVDIDRTFGEQLASVDRIPAAAALLAAGVALRGRDAARRRRSPAADLSAAGHVARSGRVPPLLGRGDAPPCRRRLDQQPRRRPGRATCPRSSDAVRRGCARRRGGHGDRSGAARGADEAQPVRTSRGPRRRACPARWSSRRRTDPTSSRNAISRSSRGSASTSRTTGSASRAGSLRAWADGPRDRWTAFHSLYLDVDGPPAGRPATTDEPVVSPFLLTPVQRRAVVRSRTEPVTLVSGAPGTGKSHTVAAIACARSPGARACSSRRSRTRPWTR